VSAIASRTRFRGTVLRDVASVVVLAEVLEVTARCRSRCPWYFEPRADEPYGTSAGVVICRKLTWRSSSRVQRDRQVRHVRQLERHVTVPTRVDEARGVSTEHSPVAGNEVLDLPTLGRTSRSKIVSISPVSRTSTTSSHASHHRSDARASEAPRQRLLVCGQQRRSVLQRTATRPLRRSMLQTSVG